MSCGGHQVARIHTELAGAVVADEADTFEPRRLPHSAPDEDRHRHHGPLRRARRVDHRRGCGEPRVRSADRRHASDRGVPRRGAPVANAGRCSCSPQGRRRGLCHLEVARPGIQATNVSLRRNANVDRKDRPGDFARSEAGLLQGGFDFFVGVSRHSLALACMPSRWPGVRGVGVAEAALIPW